MNRSHLLALPIVIALALFAGALPGRADENDFSNPFTIHLPSTLPQLTSWDIEWVNPQSNTLTVTDRNDRSLDVYDTQDPRYLRSSHGVDFAGINPTTAPCNQGGPNGVVIVPRGDEDTGHHHDHHGDDDQAMAATMDVARLHSAVGLDPANLLDDHDSPGRGNAWAGGAGSGASSAAVVNLDSGSQIGADIPTGGTCRADELGFARGEDEVMLGNPSESTNKSVAGLNNFETFISTSGTPGPNSVLARLVFDATGAACTTVTRVSLGITGGSGNMQLCHTPAGDTGAGGLEQPAFAAGYFWLSVPGSTPAGHVDQIDPDTYKVVGSIALTGCGTGPTGLVIVSNSEGAVACPNGVTFVNLSTKTQDGSQISESGGADEIYFANGNVYAVDSVDDAAATPAAGCGDPTTIALAANVTGNLAACLAVVSAGSKNVVAEVHLPVGARNVAADSSNGKVFVPVKDLDCSDGLDGGPSTCPPTSASPTTCPVPAEEGGCIHDQGVAVIVQSP